MIFLVHSLAYICLSTMISLKALSIFLETPYLYCSIKFTAYQQKSSLTKWGSLYLSYNRYRIHYIKF